MVLTKFQERISGEHHFADLGTKKYWLMADIFEWFEITPKDERSMTRQISDLLKRRGFYRRRVRKNNRIMNMWLTNDPSFDSNARILSETGTERRVSFDTHAIPSQGVAFLLAHHRCQVVTSRSLPHSPAVSLTQ